MNYKVLTVTLGRRAIFATIANFKTREVFDLYVMISHKLRLCPWKDSHFGGKKVDLPVWGWLWFYWGRSTSGLLVKKKPDKNEHRKILIYNHHTYQVFKATNRKESDMIQCFIRKKGRKNERETVRLQSTICI